MTVNLIQLHFCPTSIPVVFGVFVQFYDSAFNSGKEKALGREEEGPKSWGKRESGGIWLAVIAIVVVAA